MINFSVWIPGLLGGTAVQAPVNYRYAALMLAARTEYQAGSKAVADREYRLLAEKNTGYVKDWARQELANHSWQAGRIQDTHEIIKQLCNSDIDGVWKPLSCRISEYLDKYRESQEGVN